MEKLKILFGVLQNIFEILLIQIVCIQNSNTNNSKHLFNYILNIIPPDYLILIMQPYSFIHRDNAIIFNFELFFNA